MSGTTHMNIILGQGTTIKEVHNVKKQNLEMNQQFVAQQSDAAKKEDKSKVEEFETKNKIEIKKEKDKKEDQKGDKKESKDESQKEKLNLLEGKLIDIIV